MSGLVYDRETMPCIMFPLEDNVEGEIVCFGGEFMHPRVTATVNSIARSDAENTALYRFWKEDCEYKTKPFLIDLSIKEGEFKVEDGLEVFFDSGIKTRWKSPSVWDVTFNLRIIRKVSYVAADDGYYLLSDGNRYDVVDF